MFIFYITGINNKKAVVIRTQLFTELQNCIKTNPIKSYCLKFFEETKQTETRRKTKAQGLFNPRLNNKMSCLLSFYLLEKFNKT